MTFFTYYPFGVFFDARNEYVDDNYLRNWYKPVSHKKTHLKYLDPSDVDHKHRQPFPYPTCQKIPSFLRDAHIVRSQYEEVATNDWFIGLISLKMYAIPTNLEYFHNSLHEQVEKNKNAYQHLIESGKYWTQLIQFMKNDVESHLFIPSDVLNYHIRPFFLQSIEYCTNIDVTSLETKVECEWICMLYRWEPTLRIMQCDIQTLTMKNAAENLGFYICYENDYKKAQVMFVNANDYSQIFLSSKMINLYNFWCVDRY